jgi:hypothetical protein
MNRDPYDDRICAICLSPMEAMSHDNNHDNLGDILNGNYLFMSNM